MTPPTLPAHAVSSAVAAQASGPQLHFVTSGAVLRGVSAAARWGPDATTHPAFPGLHRPGSQEARCMERPSGIGG